MTLVLTKIDKLKLTALCVKAVTGVLGVSVILTENHPYTAITVLSIGAATNELIMFLKDKESKV